MDNIDGSHSVLLSSDENRERNVIITCACHMNLEATYYCDPHHVVICQVCMKSDHTNCKTATVKDKSVDYVETGIKVLSQKTIELKKLNENIVKSRKSVKEQIEPVKDSIRTKINNFRQEINQVLDRLEKETIDKFEEIWKQKSKELEDDISICTMIDEKIKEDYNILQDVMQTKKIEKLFAADINVTRHLQRYEKSLAEIIDKNTSPNLLFEKNISIIEELRKLKGIGHVTSNNRTEVNSNDESYEIDKTTTVSLGTQEEIKKSFVNLKPQTFSITYGAQNKKSLFSGCAFTPEGQVVLCDKTNHAILKLSRSFSTEEGMILTKQPFDIAVMNSNVAIVTCPEQKQLEYIELEPKLKSRNVVTLNKKCWGIDIDKKIIYITCHNKNKIKKDGEVRILDFEGNFIKKLGVKDGTYMFCWPFYIAFNQRSSKLFVSDGLTGTVTCIDWCGDVIYESKDDGLKRMTGICVDNEDNIIICDKRSSKVKMLTASGKEYCSIVTSLDGIGSPQSIAYGKNDSVILIGLRNTNYVYAKWINT